MIRGSAGCEREPDEEGAEAVSDGETAVEGEECEGRSTIEAKGRKRDGEGIAWEMRPSH